MDNEKRILLAILLSIVILYVYQAYFVPPPQKVAQKPAVEQQQKETPPALITPQQSVKNIQLKPLPQQAVRESVANEKNLVVTTDLFTATFSSMFAGPSSFKLHKYRDSIDPPAVVNLIKKIFSSGAGTVTAEQKDQTFKELIHLKEGQMLPLKTLFVNADGTLSSTTGWQTDKDKLNLDSTNKEDSISFSGTDQKGLTLEKKFLFNKNDYKIDFTFAVRNTSTTVYTGNAVVEWTAPVPPKQGGGFLSGSAAPVSEFAYFINGKVEKKALGSIKEDMTIEGDILWTSIEEKYFTSAILFKDQKPAQVRIGKSGESLDAYQLLFPAISLSPGEEKLYSLSLYLGPKDIDILQQQGAHLEKSVVFGWFDIIAKPLLLALKFFYNYFGNYGLAIILITIIIKILFWPLTHKSFESMKGMQKIQPEIAQLKEKYKDNKEEFAKQQLGLYKKYKVNPLSGCLPTLIQIPVFIALYNSLMYSIELRHANFITFWINDLSEKDPTYIAPIIMGISMMVQQKMTPSTADPAQAKMMMFMPIIMTVMFLSFPSGLVIYWLVNNVISIAQQLYINNKLTESGGKECIPSKSKQNPSKKRSS